MQPTRGIDRKRHAAAAMLGVLAAVFLVTGCRESSPGDYLALTGKIFIFNYRVADATYLLTLEKKRPVPEGAFVEARLENPAGGLPFVVTQKVWPKLAQVTIESPSLTCVRTGKQYAIEIRLKDAGGAVLQTISTSLHSSMDQSVLPDRPLIVGPAYERNPDLAGHPDGKLGPSQEPACPPV